MAAEGVELVNAGSVGLPFDGDTRAAYAVLREGGEAELRRVEYDHRALGRRRPRAHARASATTWRVRIETAQPPG